MFHDGLTTDSILRATAAARPDHIAIEQGALRLTYRQLDEAVDRLAAHLHQAGLARGDRIAYLFANQWEILAAYHAIGRLGAVVVSLNYRLTPAELDYQLSRTTARALLYDESFGPALAELPASLRASIYLISAGAPADGPPPQATMAGIMAGPRGPVPDAAVRGADDSGIWFTSGTTGRPKGAIVRHASSVASAEVTAQVCRVTERCRFLATAPMFHRGAMEDMHLAVTMVGGTHVLLPRFQARRALEMIESERISHAFIVPTMARMMVDEPGCEQFDLGSMERWISASAPFPAELAARVRQRLRLAENVVMDVYGITESLLNTHCQPAEKLARPTSVGRPVPKMQLRIVDAADRPLAAGEVGEIVTAGPTTFRSYLSDAEAFRAAVFSAEGRTWYRTGDVGYLDRDGFLHIVDRKKDMIITGGENVYCVEVEAAIATHPGVAEVAVVGWPDEVWGERVVAVVVARPGVALAAAEITAWCATIAPYKRPREIRFVDALARNSFGKIQKAVLRRPPQ